MNHVTSVSKLAPADLSCHHPKHVAGRPKGGGEPVDLLTVKVVMSELNKEVVDLVWGRPSSGGVSASIFRRWTQGMMLCLSLMVSMKVSHSIEDGSDTTRVRTEFPLFTIFLLLLFVLHHSSISE